MGFFGGKGNFDNGAILFFIILFLLLFDGFGREDFDPK
jgi:hypothetical protein